MTCKTFVVLFLLYLGVVGVPMSCVFSSQYKKCDIPGWHYAIDTITLRGRIPDPLDDDLKNATFFKLWEDLSSLAVFVFFGLGIGFSISTIDALWAVKLFERETPEERHRLPTFKEWMKEKHPETYYGLYPQEQGPAKSGGLRRMWLWFKRWLLGIREEDGR